MLRPPPDNGVRPTRDTPPVVHLQRPGRAGAIGRHDSICRASQEITVKVTGGWRSNTFGVYCSSPPSTSVIPGPLGHQTRLDFGRVTVDNITLPYVGVMMFVYGAPGFLLFTLFKLRAGRRESEVWTPGVRRQRASSQGALHGEDRKISRP